MQGRLGRNAATTRWPATALMLLVLGSGCQSGGPPRSLASTEPALTTAPDGAGVAVTPVPRTVSWVDRHPLFSKPRDYYESSGENRIVKATAATVIGIPAGIFGELRQIVVGAPPVPRY